MKTRGLKKLGIILLILFLMVPLVYSLTASIDKPRMVLYKNITGNELEFQNSVIVNNVNDKDISISINPSGDWKDKMIIDEPEFVLEKGGTKEVFYTVTITEPGYYLGDVLVKFSEETSKTHISLAQELEVFVKDISQNSMITGGVIGVSNFGKFFGIGLVLILGLALLIVIKLMRNKK